MPVEVQNSIPALSPPAVQNPDSSPADDDAPPLPGAMANLTPERRAALLARQQNERTVQERAQQSITEHVGVFSKIIWFLAFRAACTAAFSILLYKKLGLGTCQQQNKHTKTWHQVFIFSYLPNSGIDFSWHAVFAPMLLASAVRVFGSFHLARLQYKQDNAGDTQMYIPQICHMVNGLAYIAFYILLMSHLNGHGPQSFTGGILVPAWVSIAMSIMIPTVFFRPKVAENDLNEQQRVAFDAGEEVRRTGNDVFNKALNEQVMYDFLRICHIYHIYAIYMHGCVLM